MTPGSPRLCKCSRCKMIRSENAFPRGLDRRRQGTICLQCLRPAEKKCSGCKKMKPIRFFNRDYSSPDLHCNHCKECQREARQRNKKSGNGVHGYNPRLKSWEQARVREAAMLAQKRDPEADYHANYRGVTGPIIFGCVAPPNIVTAYRGIEHVPGVYAVVEFNRPLNRGAA